MRPNISVIYSLIRTVSIHASVKDATFQILFSTAKVSFNPRICKRCDFFKGKSSDDNSVSIHASVKDATVVLCHYYKIFKVSIHASVKDATLISTNRTKKTGFNPRICKRCDITKSHFKRRNTVSIHASVKDATPCL